MTTPGRKLIETSHEAKSPRERLSSYRSYRAIAAEFGISHQTVMRLFANLVQVSQIEQVDHHQ